MKSSSPDRYTITPLATVVLNPKPMLQLSASRSSSKDTIASGLRNVTGLSNDPKHYILVLYTRALSVLYVLRINNIRSVSIYQTTYLPLQIFTISPWWRDGSKCSQLQVAINNLLNRAIPIRIKLYFRNSTFSN